MQEEAQQPQKSLVKRVTSLILALGALYIFVFVLAPLPIKYFEPMKQYAEGAEALGISPGSLYYTDVPVTSEAEFYSRRAVRHYYESRKQEKAAKAKPSRQAKTDLQAVSKSGAE